MDRRAEILKYVHRSQLGIELGPWHSPLAPKAEGYNCLAMDVFDTETLRSRAAIDPNVPAELAARIEPVDLVGSANELRKLAQDRGILGKVDYVISSHNIEHLPDPIAFLQDCFEVLKPGGFVSLAIPDRRACFDFFRPATTLSQWIDAHFLQRVRPTEAQVFELECLGADYDRGETRSAGFDLDTESPEKLVPFNRLKSALGTWRERLQTGATDYRDTHCWAFTPSSFELLVRDCRYLGLSRLDVVSVTPARSHEFYAHLQSAREPDSGFSDEEHLKMRGRLLHAVVSESGSNSLGSSGQRDRASQLVSTLAESTQASEALKARVEHAEQTVRLQMNDIDVLRRQVADASGAIAAAKVRIAALENSTSWRITSPIRALGGLFRTAR